MMQYTNRRGDRYYVLQGKTKTGKPAYHCSKKPHGMPVERLPDGYELREDPVRATVTVRKVRPTRIASLERELVVRLAEKLKGVRTIVDVDGDSIVVYSAEREPRAAKQLFEMLAVPGMSKAAKMEDFLARHANYSPMLRFTLVDEDERLFRAERWCFRGSIDDWIDLAGEASLEELAAALLPHLGEESFYDLM
jgi:hypothetical protein